MKAFATLKPGNKKYLIIPAMPTPNGRLHLGHMSGPYLKMDILARAQKRNGNLASVISGSDSYESYISLKSWLTGMTPEEVCSHFSALSLRDLQALGIPYDDFVNPVSPVSKQGFIDFAYEKMSDLERKGATEVRPEQYLWSPSSDRYIVGCWLQGNCPVCGSKTASYQCENCGNQYRPMDILNPSSRANERDLLPIDDYTLYLRVRKKDQLWEHIDSMGIDERFKEIVKTYFRSQGDYIRLTNPDTWGIPWKVKGGKISSVIYSATFMNVYAVYLGEKYKKLTGDLLNPFHPNSGVITVCSFGIDCCIPYIAGLAWALESQSFKPMDYLLPNYFCNLEEAKFSTSRDHVIWTEEIVNKTPAGRDAVRYYLAMINPEHGTTSFRVHEFIETINSVLADQLQRLLTKTWSSIDCQPIIPSDSLVTKLELLLLTQLYYLTPPGFELAKSLEPLNTWVDEVESFTGTDLYWWMKGFALLAYPLMPDCAESIWALLGHQNKPSESDFFIVTRPEVEQELPVFFKRVNFEEISRVLPESLSHIGQYAK